MSGRGEDLARLQLRTGHRHSSLYPVSHCVRGEVIVQGDEGPVGGVAQVICHGVIVVVGHQEEGQEEEGEKQGKVEGEVEKLRDNRTSWMVWSWVDKRVNGLEPCGV